MGKLHKLLHPYTFRNRAMGVLLISSVIASFFSLASSFIYGVISVREELALNQHAVAIYLLELGQVTDLSPAEIVNVADNDILSVKLTITAPEEITHELRQYLRENRIVTVSSHMLGQPETYLELKDTVVSIVPSRRINVFALSFVRVFGSVTMCLMIFVVMSWMASRNLARPVTALTNATRQVSDGDFSVKLPDNVAGEVGELMRSFNSMTDQLGKTSYLQKDFISSISHEFRTPIASIRGFARLLQMDGLDDDARREYVDMIVQESDRLSRLAETLLRLSALEQQAAPACCTEFRLDEQLRQVILRLEPTWSAHQIEWQLDLQQVTIYSDSELLVQVWINLLQNAVKFSADGSIIEVSVSGGTEAVVTVRDHGVGMDETALTRIFDRFYQVDGSRSKQGVGLGLCLVKRILDILHGTVSVESTPGMGSTFVVRLPLQSRNQSSEEN